MQLLELLTPARRCLLSDVTEEDTTGKKTCCTYKQENTDTLIDPKRTLQKARRFANVSENPCLREGSTNPKLTWLCEVLVTPHTVVTTDREPGGWLVFCCQGTES